MDKLNTASPRLGSPIGGTNGYVQKPNILPPKAIKEISEIAGEIVPYSLRCFVEIYRGEYIVTDGIAEGIKTNGIKRYWVFHPLHSLSIRSEGTGISKDYVGHLFNADSYSPQAIGRLIVNGSVEFFPEIPDESNNLYLDHLVLAVPDGLIRAQSMTPQQEPAGKYKDIVERINSLNNCYENSILERNILLHVFNQAGLSTNPNNYQVQKN